VTPAAHFLEYLDLAGTILKRPAEVENGAVRAHGPGLGLEWDEAAVSRHAA
jgi:mandelate racemase